MNKIILILVLFVINLNASHFPNYQNPETYGPENIPLSKDLITIIHETKVLICEYETMLLNEKLLSLIEFTKMKLDFDQYFNISYNLFKCYTFFHYGLLSIESYQEKEKTILKKIFSKLAQPSLFQKDKTELSNYALLFKTQTDMEHSIYIQTYKNLKDVEDINTKILSDAENFKPNKKNFLSIWTKFILGEDVTEYEKKFYKKLYEFCLDGKIDINQKKLDPIHNDINLFLNNMQDRLEIFKCISGFVIKTNKHIIFDLLSEIRDKLAKYLPSTQQKTQVAWLTSSQDYENIFSYILSNIDDIISKKIPTQFSIDNGKFNKFSNFVTKNILNTFFSYGNKMPTKEDLYNFTQWIKTTEDLIVNSNTPLAITMLNFSDWQSRYSIPPQIKYNYPNKAREDDPSQISKNPYI